MENSLFYSQFSPLNAGNRLLGLCNFNIFWGSMPQTLHENVDCWYSQLLYSNLLATSISIETHDLIHSKKYWSFSFKT